MTRRAGLAVGLALALAATAPARGQPAQPPPAAEVRLGHVELADDPRYDADRVYARIQLQPTGRPLAGAELGLQDAETVGRVIRTRFALERASGRGVDALLAEIDRWQAERGIRFVLADLPAAALAELARRTRDREIVLFNTSAVDDSLRGEHCQPHLLHTMPSQAMLGDALAQFLTSKRWRDVLVLEGPLPGDRTLAEAFRRSARKLGLRIVDTKPFQLSNDPRHREETNVALMTGAVGHDVVFLADTDGEFGRYVPYSTQLPRPVVGTTGLVPEVWHWSWERQGAPQVNSRFEKLAGRRMAGGDWAAWVAVKAVVQGVLRTRTTEFRPLVDFILSDKLNLDGSKGSPMTFRPWDRQLRQPLFLATHNAVIERAPLRGFLHQVNELDTLGPDRPETACRF